MLRSNNKPGEVGIVALRPLGLAAQCVQVVAGCLEHHSTSRRTCRFGSPPPYWYSIEARDHAPVLIARAPSLACAPLALAPSHRRTDSCSLAAARSHASAAAPISARAIVVPIDVYMDRTSIHPKAATPAAVDAQTSCVGGRSKNDNSYRGDRDTKQPFHLSSASYSKIISLPSFHGRLFRKLNVAANLVPPVAR